MRRRAASSKEPSLRYPGTIIKNVQTSDGTYYLIVGCENVDRYVISLETLPAGADRGA